jgi:hypothetical protein
MKRLLLIVLASSAVAGGAFYGYERWHSKVEEDAKAKAQYDADQQNIKLEIVNLGAKYKAVSDWRAGLRSDSVYSATLQNKLMPRDGRPILFLGELHDVANAGDSRRCVFDSYGEGEIRFVLDCSQEVADYGMLQRPRPRFRNFFAVVAQIGSVAKLDAQNKEERQDDQEAKFQANGRCVDLISISNYGDFLELYGLSDFKRIEH